MMPFEIPRDTTAGGMILHALQPGISRERAAEILSDLPRQSYQKIEALAAERLGMTAAELRVSVLRGEQERRLVDEVAPVAAELLRERRHQGAHHTQQGAHLFPIEHLEHLASKSLSEIDMKPVEWLFPGVIPRGKHTTLAGDPGLGKSLVTISFTAVVTTGGHWPVERSRCKLGSVIILSGEDDAADTIKPRLIAAGGDPMRVHIVSHVVSAKGNHSFDVRRDVEKLTALIEQIGDVALVIIDPISCYLGDADSYKNSEVRAALTPLSDMAARLGIAVVSVTHFSKGGAQHGKTAALLKVMGSIGFVAAARAAFGVFKDPADPHRRLFLPLKNNLADDTPGYAFTVGRYTLANGIETSRISWECDYVSVTADEVLNNNPPRESRLDAAKAFLKDSLSGGGASECEVEDLAEKSGHSWATIRRAKKDLGVKSIKDHTGRGWLWVFQNKGAQDAQGAQDAHEVENEHLEKDDHLFDDTSNFGEVF